MSLSLIDIIFILIILIASLRGAYVGMIAEIVSLASLFISLLLAAVFYGDGAEWIQDRSSLNDIAYIIAFAGIFLVCFIVFKILQKGIVKLVDDSAMEGMDKILGFFFGILEGILIIFLVVYLINFQTFFDISGIVKGSELIPYMERFLPALDVSGQRILEQMNI